MSNSDIETSSAAISIENCSKSYYIGKKEIEVLKGVDLEIQTGEIVSLLGASGTGKSTLLHIIGGLDTSDKGTVRCGEHLLHDLKEGQLSHFRNQHVGFIFQAYHLLPELTALENVCLPARMARTSIGYAQDKAKQLLKSVGLDHRMDHRPYEMSGGEQQRTSIARSMINAPTFLLADEPTGNLDSKTGGEIFSVLLNLREEFGVTLVIATHDQSLAQKTDRVIHLVDGKVAK